MFHSVDVDGVREEKGDLKRLEGMEEKNDTSEEVVENARKLQKFKH